MLASLNVMSLKYKITKLQILFHVYMLDLKQLLLNNWIHSGLGLHPGKFEQFYIFKFCRLLCVAEINYLKRAFHNLDSVMFSFQVSVNIS